SIVAREEAGGGEALRAIAATIDVGDAIAAAFPQAVGVLVAAVDLALGEAVEAEQYVVGAFGGEDGGAARGERREKARVVVERFDGGEVRRVPAARRHAIHLLHRRARRRGGV